MTPHLALPIHEPSQIGDARRRAARLAEEIGFDAVAAGRLALVVTELATNLVRHAREGSLLIGRHDGHDGGDGASVELLALDRGPGIADVDAAMRDGASTFGSPGTGLGAVRRLSNLFLIHTRAEHGTVIVARVAADSAHGPFDAAAPERYSYAGIAITAPGEVESGDGWACAPTARGATLLVADGLGHGPEAARAAAEALRVFGAMTEAAPQDILAAAHPALRSTRGAAVAVVSLDIEARSVMFCGAGNVSARLISGLEDRSLMSQHGTIGLQIRRLQDLRYDWPEHAVLIVHSDGLLTRWDLRAEPGLLGREAIVIAAWLIREQCRGRDDATVVVLRLVERSATR